MITRLMLLLVLVCILATGLAAASTLEVDGGTSQVFSYPVDPPTVTSDDTIATTDAKPTGNGFSNPNIWRVVNGN